MTNKDNMSSIDAIWDALAKTFSNWKGVRPQRHWITTGMTERLGYLRVRKLQVTPMAVRFFELTKGCNPEDIDDLYTRACVNYEQAVAAARLHNVLNVTLVVGLIVLGNQIFPGQIAKFLSGLNLSNPSAAALGSISCFILAFGFVIMHAVYAYGGVAMARDLKNLLELSMAGRKRNVEMLDIEGISDSKNVLKETYLID